MDKRDLATTIMAAMIAVTIGSRSAAAPAGYVPGLGEFMTATQMRHSKLWFAGQAGNWALASYELDEIKEGFADITRFHPTHPGSPVPIREILPKLMAAPLARLQVAIRSQNLDKFDEAFDSLTASCNACHQAEKFGFNVITRPRSNPYTNQDFSPASTSLRFR
jgi:cytochrome c553